MLLSAATIRNVNYKKGNAGYEKGNEVESYDVHFDADGEEEIVFGVDDELVYEANDDDYWDEWNDVRQNCGILMLKRTARIHLRRHKVHGFVQWRMTARAANMERKLKAQKVNDIMKRSIDIMRRSMDGAMMKCFFSWRQIVLKGDKSFFGDKRWQDAQQDCATLIQHIHGLTAEKGETGDRHGRASWIRVVNVLANKRIRDKTSVFRSAVLKHREETRRRDTSLQDQIKQLTLRNAVMEKELEDTKLVHTNVCKHNTQLKNDILAAIDERDTAMEDVQRAQRDAREAREEVRRLRDQLAGGSLQAVDGSNQIPITDNHLLSTNAPTPATEVYQQPARSRFSAISAYSASIAGLDS